MKNPCLFRQMPSQFHESKKMKNISLNLKNKMSALTKQVQGLNENSVKTIQDTVHSVMTSAPSQQTAATIAPSPSKINLSITNICTKYA